MEKTQVYLRKEELDALRKAAARSRGRLRRAQTFLRVRGIEVAFSREGRAGTWVIRIHTRAENTVSTVSIVCGPTGHLQGGASQVESCRRKRDMPDLRAVVLSRLRIHYRWRC